MDGHFRHDAPVHYCYNSRLLYCYVLYTFGVQGAFNLQAQFIVVQHSSSSSTWSCKGAGRQTRGAIYRQETRRRGGIQYRTSNKNRLIRMPGRNPEKYKNYEVVILKLV